MNTFTIKECFSFGWKTFKARPGLFILVPFIIFVAGFIGGFVGGIASTFLGKTVGSLIAFIISTIINTFAGIGVITLYLKAHDDVAGAKLSLLWNPKPFWRFLGAGILVSFCVIIGFLLLIVPGIIVSLMLTFALYLVIDRGMFPIAAMKESARITKGKRWKLLLFVGAALLLNLLGIILLVVGLLVTVPVTVMALVHAYRVISGASSSPVTAPAPVMPPAPAKAFG